MGLIPTGTEKRVKVKICGITCPEDALVASKLGVDAIGMVFFRESPRAIDFDAAIQIASVLPPEISKVGLFVDAGESEVRDTLNAVPLDILQFHGDEEPEYCNGFSMPFIKAVKMQENVEIDTMAEKYGMGSALLLDTHVAGLHGGTGKSFDWSKVPPSLPIPVILAGGLNPDNVFDAIRQVMPYAVDVSGGVESVKGKKDSSKMKAFVEQVNLANDEFYSKTRK